jgi:DNA-binding transcriptional LysR family regulator
LIDLDQLVVFLTAAKYGNFSKAGKELNISQPAISQTISSLERRFGLELFVRQGRSVKLTEAGQALRPIATELLSMGRRLEDTMASLHGEVIGEINIGCSTTSGKYLLPILISRFRQQFPQVRINVHITSRDNVMRKLLSGEVQLGVSSKRLDYHDLEYEDFFTDDVILVAPASHWWANYPVIYPDDLLDEPVILREEGAGTREVMFEGLRRHDVMPDSLKVAMVLGNAEAIGMAVEEGIGVAFISRLAACRGIALGRLVEVKVAGMPLSRCLYLARNRRLSMTRAQTEFWDFVIASRDHIKELCEFPRLP